MHLFIYLLTFLGWGGGGGRGSVMETRPFKPF